MPLNKQKGEWGKKRINLLVRSAYEWGGHDTLGQEDNPYRQMAKARCEKLRDELIELLFDKSVLREEQIMTEARDWVAEHIMGFKRAWCDTYPGGASLHEFWCKFCHTKRPIGYQKPCPKGPFPNFTLVALMRELGKKGHNVIVRIDPERTSDSFTVILNPAPFVTDGGRIGDTDNPLELLCDFLYVRKGLWCDLYSEKAASKPIFFAKIHDAIKLLQEALKGGL